MLRAPFLFIILTKKYFLHICKIPPLYCKRKTQALAYHQTKGTFFDQKRALFSLIVTWTQKGFTFFLLRNKASTKIQQNKSKEYFYNKLFRQKSNPCQNPSCFLQKRGKNGSRIPNGYSGLINISTTLSLVSNQSLKTFITS